MPPNNSDKQIEESQDFFFELEARDEQQMIAEYEGQVLKELTYQARGKTAISYMGIKFIVGKLGHIKVLPESIKAEYIEKPEPMWVATVVALNEKYSLQLPGAAEQPYIMETQEGPKVDPFARRKSISKATRNALRAVIPEAMILKFLEDVAKGEYGPDRVKRDSDVKVTDFMKIPEIKSPDYQLPDALAQVDWKTESVKTTEAWLVAAKMTPENFEVIVDNVKLTVKCRKAISSEDKGKVDQVFAEHGFNVTAKGWRLNKKEVTG